MTKAEIITRIYEKVGFSKKEEPDVVGGPEAKGKRRPRAVAAGGAEG